MFEVRRDPTSDVKLSDVGHPGGDCWEFLFVKSGVLVEQSTAECGGFFVCFYLCVSEGVVG